MLNTYTYILYAFVINKQKGEYILFFINFIMLKFKTTLFLHLKAKLKCLI